MTTDPKPSEGMPEYQWPKTPVPESVQERDTALAELADMRKERDDLKSKLR